MTLELIRGEISQNKKEAVVLFAALLTALALRLYTYGYDYLMGVDPFHHFKIAEYILESGEFPERWHLSRYPEGETIVQPRGFYYTSIFLYKILGPLGFSFMGAFKLATPLFGIMALVPVYYLTKHLFDRRTALLSVLVLALLPAFIYRTLSGFYRGEAFFTFFMVLGFYFYLKFENLRFAVLAGLCFGLMGLVWNGFLFGFAVLSIFLVLYAVATYVIGEKSKNALLGYVIAVVIGVGIINLTVAQGYQPAAYAKDLTRYIAPLTIAFAGSLELLKYRTSAFTHKGRAVHVIGVTVLSLAFAVKFYPEVLGKMLGGYGLIDGSDVFLQTIGELTAPSLEALWQYFSVAAFMFLGGVVFLLREPKLKYAFVAAWSLAGLYVLQAAIRYTFLASIPIGIIAGLFLNELYKLNIKKISRLKILLPGILLLILAWSGIQFTTNTKPIISDEWYEALSFLETQEPGTVMTWWDYGSWVQGVTGFPTVTDTVHGQDVNRIRETALLLLETNETAILKALEKFDTKYLVINVNMIGQMKNINAVLGTNYQYPLYIYSGKKQVFGATAADYSDLFVLDTADGKLVLLNNGGNVRAVARVYWREESLQSLEYSGTSTLEGMVYIPEKEMFTHFPDKDFIIYVSPVLERTLLTSLMLLDGKGFNRFELVFKNSQVRIYKINI